MGEKEQTFWDHLDELRKVIFRVFIVVALITTITFLFKDTLFSVVLAPSKSDFALYRFFCWLGEVLSMPSLCPGAFHVDLISTQLTSQFMIHLSTALYASVLLASPYVIYQLFRFVSPALYTREKQYATRVVFYSLLLFFMGVLLSYYLIFPLSFRFLATYQVSEEVMNTITLASYMDTFLMLSLLLGILFEIPVIMWCFAKLGFLTPTFLRTYRRHAIVLVLIVAAIITPTTDIFTLLLVSVPIYALYEISIGIVKRAVSQREKEEKWEDPYDQKTND